jgi:hypothetical protein
LKLTLRDQPGDALLDFAVGAPLILASHRAGKW